MNQKMTKITNFSSFYDADYLMNYDPIQKLFLKLTEIFSIPSGRGLGRKNLLKHDPMRDDLL